MGTITYTNCEPFNEEQWKLDILKDGINDYAKSLLEDELTNARESFEENGHTQEELLDMFPHATHEEIEEAIVLAVRRVGY